MPKEHAEIRQVLAEAGVLSWALAQVGSERELYRLFQDDFESLVTLCRQ